MKASLGASLRSMLCGTAAVMVLAYSQVFAQTGGHFGATTPPPSGEIDSVTWALATSEPESLDWIYAWDYASQNTILANMCEGLRRENPDGTMGFALATDVRMPDPTTYVYTLREGVTFADGTTMTADDVVFSLSRHLGSEPASYWELWYQNVEAITATGPLEVTIKLRQPDMLLDRLMSTPVGYVGKKSFIEAAGAAYGTPSTGVMCTGPFKLGVWNPGQDITLDRHDGYWDAGLKAKAKQIRFVSIIDPSAMAAALLTGEVDGAWAMATTILPTLSTADSGDLYTNSGTEAVAFQPISFTGALADKRVRQALRAVIDYQGIVQGVLGNAGEAIKTLTPRSLWGDHANEWDKAFGDLPEPKQDLDQARTLLAEAGVPAQPIVIIVNAEDAQILSSLAAIQHAAASVGLKIEIRKLPPAEFLGFFYDPAAREGADLFASMVTAEIPDPLELFSQIIPGAPYNFSNLTDPAFADPIVTAMAEPDAAKRAELTAQAERALIDNAYYFPIYAVHSRVFLGDRITGVPVSTLSQLYYPWAATIGQR